MPVGYFWEMGTGAFDEGRPSLRRLNIARASGSIGAGRYRVFANIGRGGMADVLLGVAPGTKGFNKLLVVKRLRPALAEDAAMVSMFLDEARLAARLSHTNLVHTFEIGEEAGGYFIVMEYLEGRPVSQIIEALKETKTSIPVEVWAKVVSEALAGLHYAHELCDYDGLPLKVVHRDVSPQNIIITFDGGVKLVDFGIAKASVNITETESGVLKGKLAYMAPEQARFGVDVDRRADVFASGIVLWEALTMRRLITGDTITAARKLQDMKFPPPSSENPKVPPELDAITLRALEREPGARYQTAAEMQHALEDYLQRSGHYVQEAAIGAPIAKLFAEQREDVRAQIRMHMTNLRRERESSEAADKSGSTSSPGIPRERGDSGDVEWPRELASLPKIELTDSVRSMRAVQKSGPAPGEQPAANAPMRRLWQASLVIAGVAFLAILSWPIVSPRQPPASGAASATAPILPPLGEPPGSTPPPSASLSSPPVHVALSALPPGAVITLDDAPLTNPFSGSFARDGLVHRLQVTRDGYASEGRLLRFDGDDVDLTLSLPPLADASASESKPHPAPNGAPRPSPGARPQLDKDPYK
jgi:serine/threonine protein kinase